MESQGLDQIVAQKLKLDLPPADLHEWAAIVEAKRESRGEVNVAMVGKYVDLRDSYISLDRGAAARRHPYAHARQYPLFRVAADRTEGPECLAAWTASSCRVASAIAASRARFEPCSSRVRTDSVSRHLPRLQVAVIEAARNLAGLDGAQSTEFDRQTPHPVVALITEWQTGRATLRNATNNRILAARCAWAPSRSSCRTVRCCVRFTAVGNCGASPPSLRSEQQLPGATARPAWRFPDCRSTIWSR